MNDKAQAVQVVLDWWVGVLTKAGLPKHLSAQLVLHTQGRPARVTAAARRQLAAYLITDLGPDLARRWLAVTTSLSRKTLDTLVPRPRQRPGRPKKGEVHP